jgi:glycosyltransferase involved in cell wall biosynthesis
MLGVLEKLGARTRLLSYVPEDRFRVTDDKINNCLDITAICVPSSAPKILKMPVPVLVLTCGIRYINNVDIIISHSPSTTYGLPALLLSKLFDKPLLIDLTDIRDPDTPEFVYKFILKHADIVFAVSSHLVETAADAGCRNTVHAPGFIDAEAFKFKASERDRIRKELNIGDNEIAIGYVGAFSYEDGLSFLLQAFHQLYLKYNNLKLVLLGGRNVAGSDDIPRLIDELELRERVLTIPPQPYESVPGYLSAFDIACSPKVDCPANRVADPIRVYEYMSVNLPVVATNISETANAIENGIDGFLVKPEDAIDLKRMLDYVIRNLDNLQELKEKAREKVIQNYTQDVVLGKLKEQLRILEILRQY